MAESVGSLALITAGLLAWLVGSSPLWCLGCVLVMSNRPVHEKKAMGVLALDAGMTVVIGRSGSLTRSSWQPLCSCSYR